MESTFVTNYDIHGIINVVMEQGQNKVKPSYRAINKEHDEYSRGREHF